MGKVEKQSGEATENGKDWPQILTIFVACLASITNGAQFAWSSPFIVKIVNDKINYNITVAEASQFTTIHPLSTIVFSIFVPTVNDIFGRKYSIMLIAVPQLLFWLLTGIAKNIYVFYAARVISGLGDAAHFSALPMYLGEISTPNVRGRWANVVTYVIFGQFLINLIGQNFSVLHTSIICSTLPVLFLILMYFMPESPYYSVMRNDEEQAKKSLRFLRGKDDVDEEFINIKFDIERQMSEKGTWKDLFCIENNRIALCAGIFLRGAQMFSGLSPVQTYTQYIFEISGSSISSSTSSLITTGLLCFLTFFSGHIAETFGRRKSFMCSLMACGLMLLLESVYFYTDQYTTVNLDFMRWFPLLGMSSFIIVSSFGVTPIPTLMLGELFSNSIKTKGIGSLTIVLGLFIFATNSIFYYLVTPFGLFAPFLFFGICCVISTILAFYIVPETKGKTLEEIQQSLKKHKRISSDCTLPEIDYKTAKVSK